jgi:DNA polymerase-1
MDHNYRIHPKINLFKAVSGRLSSEDPSIMNIKSDSKLKSMFLPEPGEVLGMGDIKQNELRWYYINSGDEDLGEILKRVPTPDNPRANDPHYMVSVEAYGKELADELRTPAKAVVFGRLYGRGRKSIVYQVGDKNIDRLMEVVDSIFPGIGGFRKEVMERVRRDGYLESYFKRKRKFLLITPESLNTVEREAVNFMQQSPGSDLMLLNMLHLWEIKDKLGIWPFWPVHDSITSSMKDKDILPLIKKELESYSLEVVGGLIPFEWDMKWGYDWSMSHTPR